MEPPITPAAYRDFLIVDSDDGPKRLRDIIRPWQRDDFEIMDPALIRACGYQCEGGPSRAWIERGRGTSKSSDLAISVSYVLLASMLSTNLIWAAADKDQAKLGRRAIAKLVQLNPQLSQWLVLQDDRVFNKKNKAELQIISSDVQSSWGHLCSMIVADEVTAWAKRDLWDSLLSTAGKRKDCAFLNIMNSGFTTSWQWEVREAIRQDHNWHFAHLEPGETWIDEARLAEQQRLLPPQAFARLWKNQWASGAGDALSGDLIDRATTLTGPTLKPEQGWLYIAGLDLGLKRDSSALVVLGLHVGHTEEIPGEEPVLTSIQRALIDLGQMEPPVPDSTVIEHPGSGKLRLICTQRWTPVTGRQVSLEEVEREVLTLDSRFQFAAIYADQWQAARSIEALQAKGVNIVGIDPVGQNLKAQASELLSVFGDGRIELYPDEHLDDDLRALRVVEKSYGWRVESPRDASGHGDTASAFLLALLAAARADTFRAPTIQGDPICYP